MYKKTKMIMYAAVVILILLTIIALGTAQIATKSSLNNANKQEEELKQYYNKEIENEKQAYEEQQRRQSLSNIKSIKVSEETRDYMFPANDPLSEIDREESEHFETPNIPNIGKQEKNSSTIPAVTEFNPFQTQKTDPKTEQKPKQQISKSKETIKLYTKNNILNQSYEVAASFKIQDTEFYVIGYRPASIQKVQDFTNRKFYIYKRADNTIVQCFELFERQARSNKNIKSLITVNTNEDETEIMFNGPNSVTRIVDNKRILSPYGDKKDRILIIKSEE